MKRYGVTMCGLLLFSLSARSGVAAPISELPEDSPITAEVVHAEKFPYVNQNELSLGLYSLLGDKFVSAYGIGAADTFYLSDSWGIAFGGVLFTNSVDSEAETIAQSGGAAPLIHNPSYQIEADVKWQPIYGKFVIGSYVQRFRWGFLLGAHAAKEVKLADESGQLASTTSKIVFGPDGGTYLDFPITRHLSLGLNAEMYLHGGLAPGEDSRRLWDVGGSLGVRL